MIGPELVTNGNFVANVDGWDVSDEEATITWNHSGVANIGFISNSYVLQDIPTLEQGAFYIVRVTIKEDGFSGNDAIKIQLGGSYPFYTTGQGSLSGSITAIIKADIDGWDTLLKFRGSFQWFGTISNVSVRKCEISDLLLGPELVTNGTFSGSASDWTLGNGWSYADNRVSTTGAGGGFDDTLAQTLNLNYYTQYLVTVSLGTPTDIEAYINIEFGDWISDYLEPAGTDIIDGHMVLQAIDLGFSDLGFTDKTLFVFTLTNGSQRFNSWIDNISVKEILGLNIGTLSQADLAISEERTYHLDFDVESEALGPELITNGTFDTNADQWTHIDPPPRNPATEWFYNDGNIICSGGTVYPFNWCAYAGDSPSGPGVPLELGKTYRVSFDVGGTVGEVEWVLWPLGGDFAQPPIPAGTGHYSIDLVSHGDTTAYGDPYWMYFNATGGFNGTIDNVSIREVPSAIEFQVYQGTQLLYDTGGPSINVAVENIEVSENVTVIRI